MGWDTQAPSILNWAVGVDANEEVDDVDEDPEEGYSHPTGYRNVEYTTNVGGVCTEDVVDTEHEERAECCMLG